MIGLLPSSLVVGNEERPINTDFRISLLIFQAMNDLELSDHEKMHVMLECLYEDIDSIPDESLQEAIEQANWFLDGGKMFQDKEVQPKRLLDWEQDEQLIFPAINKVAGFETRSVEHIHLWTFLGFFSEIGEGLFSTVLSIRHRKSKGKKLDKHEEEFYKENKSMIDLQTKYTEAEQKEIDYWNKILG